MESFKHGCPLCGQHIEYTVEYCGKQLQCPSCGNAITFPALPPGRRGVKSSGLARLQQQQAAKAAAGGGWRFLKGLRDFAHWKIVLQCAVPFAIIVGLLYGANFVRSHFSESPPATAPAPVVQADPNAWRHMTELTRSETAVQRSVNNIINLTVQLQSLQATARSYSHGATPAATIRAAENNVAIAGRNLQRARDQFEKEMSEYQSLGGTVDYRSRLPR